MDEPRFIAFVGQEAAPRRYDIEAGHVRRFAEAVGETDAIFFDEAAARAAGHPAVPAPATFAAALRPEDPRTGLDIDFRKLLHAEQEFVFNRPLYVGDAITVVARIAATEVKQLRTGLVDFLTVETTGRDDAGAVVFVARATVAVRR